MGLLLKENESKPNREHVALVGFLFLESERNLPRSAQFVQLLWKNKKGFMWFGDTGFIAKFSSVYWVLLYCICLNFPLKISVLTTCDVDIVLAWAWLPSLHPCDAPAWVNVLHMMCL